MKLEKNELEDLWILHKKFLEGIGKVFAKHEKELIKFGKKHKYISPKMGNEP